MMKLIEEIDDRGLPGNISHEIKTTIVTVLVEVHNIIWPTMSVSSLPPLNPLVSSTLYPHLSFGLITIGLFFMAWFFTLQVTAGSKKSTDGVSLVSSLSQIVQELAIALVGCVLLGFGITFLCLNVGIYV